MEEAVNMIPVALSIVEECLQAGLKDTNLTEYTGSQDLEVSVFALLCIILWLQFTINVL